MNQIAKTLAEGLNVKRGMRIEECVSVAIIGRYHLKRASKKSKFAHDLSGPASS